MRNLGENRLEWDEWYYSDQVFLKVRHCVDERRRPKHNGVCYNIKKLEEYKRVPSRTNSSNNNKGFNEKYKEMRCSRV